ncbi:MAG: ABC transporter permease [Rhodococcus sp. (in: high G+C Gram-positive bacteria)]|nr:ABC transporter permease [Rhodococcus sp. (in: high G+C Gram-positive bacteria)]
MTSLGRTALQMRITLYRRQFKGGQAVVKTVFGVLGLVFAVVACVLSARSEASQVLVGGTASLGLTLIGLSWVLFPVLSGISDDNIQPRHFQMLSVEPARLARALLTTSAYGMVVPLTAIATAAIPIYAVSRSLATLPLALVAWPATVVLFVTLSRVVTVAMSQLLKSRRSREFALLAFGAVFGSLYFLQFPLTQNFSRVLSGDVTWPLTLAHSIPFSWGITGVDAALDGNWLLAIAAVAGLLVLDVVLVWSWQRLVLRLFEGRVSASYGASRKQMAANGRNGDRGWRATRVGAVVMRELALWRGDMRRRSQLLSVLIFAVLGGVGPLVTDSIPFSAAWGAWIVIFMAMGAGSNLYGLDGGSMWHLVMIPQALRDDVRGRQIAWLIMAAPFAIVPTAVVRVFGDLGLDRLAVPISVTLSMLGVSAGLIVMVSVRAAYPVPEPTKAFSLNTRGSFNGGSFALVLLSMVVLGLSVVPALLLALLLPGAFAYLSVPVAAAIGWLGMWWGARMAVDTLVRDSDKILHEVISR